MANNCATRIPKFNRLGIEAETVGPEDIVDS